MHINFKGMSMVNNTAQWKDTRLAPKLKTIAIWKLSDLISPSATITFDSYPASYTWASIPVYNTYIPFWD